MHFLAICNETFYIKNLSEQCINLYHVDYQRPPRDLITILLNALFPMQLLFLGVPDKCGCHVDHMFVSNIEDKFIRNLLLMSIEPMVSIRAKMLNSPGNKPRSI